MFGVILSDNQHSEAYLSPNPLKFTIKIAGITRAFQEVCTCGPSSITASLWGRISTCDIYYWYWLDWHCLDNRDVNIFEDILTCFQFVLAWRIDFPPVYKNVVHSYSRFLLMRTAITWNKYDLIKTWHHRGSCPPRILVLLFSWLLRGFEVPPWSTNELRMCVKKREQNIRNWKIHLAEKTEGKDFEYWKLTSTHIYTGKDL